MLESDLPWNAASNVTSSDVDPKEEWGDSGDDFDDDDDDDDNVSEFTRDDNDGGYIGEGTQSMTVTSV